MNWDDVKVVLAIHRGGSLTAAAKELGVDQSTVGRRLAAFEVQLKARLFNRINGRLSPTSAGELLYARAQRMEEEAFGLLSALRGHDERIAGDVKLTTISMLVEPILLPAFASFQRRHPDIFVSFMVSNWNMPIERHEADIALRLGRPENEHVLAWHVASIAYGVFAHRSLVERHGTDDVRKMPWIGYQGQVKLPELDWLKRWYLEAPVCFEINGATSRALAVSLGLGVAALPRFLLEGRPDILRLDPPDFEVERDIWMLTLPELRKTPRIAATITWLRETFAAAKPMLAGETLAPASLLPRYESPPAPVLLHG